jgi:hypothetical protein
MDLTFETIANLGFPIAITLYLLYERSQFNQKVIETMSKISTTMDLIQDKLLDKITK